MNEQHEVANRCHPIIVMGGVLVPPPEAYPAEGRSLPHGFPNFEHNERRQVLPLLVDNAVVHPDDVAFVQSQASNHNWSIVLTWQQNKPG